MSINFIELQLLEEGFLKNLSLEVFLLFSVTVILCRTLILQGNLNLNFPPLVQATRMSYVLINILALLILIETNYSSAVWLLFGATYTLDGFGLLLKFIALFATLAFLCSNKSIFSECFIGSNEFFSLVFLSLIGLVVLVNTTNFLYLFLAIEIQSLSFYTLAAFKKKSDFSIEAGIKYYILGAIASAFLLFGISLIYGSTGTLTFFEIREILSCLLSNDSEISSVSLVIAFIFIFVALLFKIGVAPFHFWVADVYEGSPSPTTAFFSLVPKICLLGALTRICFEVAPHLQFFWQPLLMGCGVFSVVIGTLGAIIQRRLKRLLAYSTIGHSGFLTLALCANQQFSVDALLTYGVIYILTTAVLFIFILNNRARSQTSENPTLLEMSSLLKTNTLLGTALAFPFFSLAGIPPLAGFIAKFQMFSVILESGYFSMAVGLVILSVIACFYYIRFVKISFFDNSNFSWSIPLSKSAALTLGICYCFMIILTVIPGFLNSFTMLL